MLSLVAAKEEGMADYCLPRDRSIGVFTTSDLASAIVLGLLFAAIVWGLYYAIRWIYKGLHNKDER